VRRWLPAVADADLSPDIAGIRPKLQAEGEPFRDFVIADEAARGRAGLIDLVGIDSPGLTAAVAIADRVAGLLGVAK
jgi:L-2-hydroxyglutarate oxidase LhgO